MVLYTAARSLHYGKFNRWEVCSPSRLRWKPPEKDLEVPSKKMFLEILKECK